MNETQLKKKTNDCSQVSELFRDARQSSLVMLLRRASEYHALLGFNVLYWVSSRFTGILVGFTQR